MAQLFRRQLAPQAAAPNGRTGSILAGIARRAASQPAVQPPCRGAGGRGANGAKQAAVSRLIQVYANRGHLVAHIDPLGLMERPMPRVLELGYFGLAESDLDTVFLTGGDTEAVPVRMKLRDIIAQLKFLYCDTIGAEFAHVSASDERLWLQTTFQERRLTYRFSVAEDGATSSGS